MGSRARVIAFSAALTIAGLIGGTVAWVLTRHKEGWATTGPLGGILLGWAVVCITAWPSAIGISRKQAQTSDWAEINKELIRDAERAAAKPWLFAIGCAFAVASEFLFLSRSLLALLILPGAIPLGWLIAKRSARWLRESVEPMSEETKRYWDRPRSP